MFGLEEKKLKNKRKRNTHEIKMPSYTKHYHKVLPFVLSGIVIVFLICYYFYINYYDNYNYIKKDTNQYLVFTSYKKTNSDKTITEIPTINIDSSVADAINKKIESFAKEFLSKKGNKMSYETQLNGDVLSLVLKMVNANTGYTPEADFYSYNINLKTLTLMTKQEILSLYGISEDTVESKIAAQFQSFYNDEVSKGIVVGQECDYECFLEWRNIQNYMDSVHYYIQQGKLIVYRPFAVHSVYGEEKYFKEEDFQFYIAG